MTKKEVATSRRILPGRRRRQDNVRKRPIIFGRRKSNKKLKKYYRIRGRRKGDTDRKLTQAKMNSILRELKR